MSALPQRPGRPDAQFEVLPLGRGEEEAARVPEPLSVTVLAGMVDRRRLLEISMRIGVGPSLAFLRKQRGLRRLLSASTVTPDRVYDALAPHLADCELNIAGFHYCTFDQLVDTWRWEREKRDVSPLTAQGGLRR
jgi:methylenetetrahydrofolate reductase (NADPH)